MVKYLRQLSKETIIYGLGGVASKFIGFFLIPLYTRVFSVGENGVIGLIITFQAAISIFIVLGLDWGASRWFFDTDNISDRKSTISSWIYCQTSLAVVVGAFLFFSAGWLSELVLGEPGYAICFQLLGISLPFSSLNVIILKWFRLEKRPVSTGVFATANNLFKVLLTILFVLVLKWGISGIFIAELISSVTFAFVAFALMKHWMIPSDFSMHRLRTMLRFSLPIIPGAVAIWVVNFSNRFFLQYFVDTEAVGLYQIGSSLAIAVSVITAAFEQAWWPFSLSIHKEDAARQVYANSFIFYLLVMCTISMTVSVFAPEIISVVATKDYINASQLVGILCFSNMFVGLKAIAAIGHNIVKTSMPTGIAVVIAAILNILLNLLLTPALGIEGAAIATFLSQALIPVLIFRWSQKLYPIPYPFINGLIVLFTSMALTFLANYIHFSNLFENILAKLGLIIIFPAIILLFRIVKISSIVSFARTSLGKS